MKIGKESKAEKAAYTRAMKEIHSKPESKHTQLRKIPDSNDRSHADIVEANTHSDTVKVRTQTNGKSGTRTYRLSTTHGLAPERISKERELEEARKRGESEHHRNIRLKTRQGEITERY